MGNSSSPSGIFYFKEPGAASDFPRDLRRGLISRIEPRFAAIFGALLIASFVAVGLLSNIPVKEETYSDKEMIKIQERYAQLVLNQPKPKVEQPVEKVQKVKTETAKGDEATEGAKKEVVKVDRAKESFVQREQRRESTRELREQAREEVKQQVMSSGIFAAITAASGSGTSSGPGVSDLLSTATGDLGDIGSISISKGAFATKNVDAATIAARKGERVSNVGIETQGVGKASVTQVASAGSVNITSTAPEITGESSSLEERSQAAIGRIVTRETQRLKRVYEDWLKRDPQLAGNLTLKFTILPNGSVSNVEIVRSSTNNSDFDDAILRYIKRWRFPEVSGGGPVEVVYPFVFEGNPG